MRCHNNYIWKHGSFTPAKTITVSHAEIIIERIIKGRIIMELYGTTTAVHAL
jgi:hypothetical protein